MDGGDEHVDATYEIPAAVFSQFGEQVLHLPRAPGETDADYLERLAHELDEPGVGLRPVTRDDFRVLARRLSRWIRRVAVDDVSTSALAPGIVEIRVRGPLGLPVPRRVRDRVAEELAERAPLNLIVRVI